MADVAMEEAGPGPQSEKVAWASKMRLLVSADLRLHSMLSARCSYLSSQAQKSTAHPCLLPAPLRAAEPAGQRGRAGEHQAGLLQAEEGAGPSPRSALGLRPPCAAARLRAPTHFPPCVRRRAPTLRQVVYMMDKKWGDDERNKLYKACPQHLPSRLGRTPLLWPDLPHPAPPHAPHRGSSSTASGSGARSAQTSSQTCASPPLVSRHLCRRSVLSPLLSARQRLARPCR